MAQDTKIPIYLITGFLESGKTSFIKEILSEESFTSEDETLLIVCEEGLEEYEEEFLKEANTSVLYFDELDNITGDSLKAADIMRNPTRVIIEYNGMWKIEDLFKIKKPDSWELFQVVTVVDSTTFEVYLNNMRSLFMDKFSRSDLIAFNRCDESTDKGICRKTARAMSPAAQIMFENTDGSIDDGRESLTLPYDINASEISVDDTDFDMFYVDAADNPDNYVGKTIKIKGMMFKHPRLKKGEYVFGRYAMTCCADDIGLIGFIAEYEGNIMEKAWVKITAKVKKEYSALHGRENCKLCISKIEQTKKPEEELVYLN